MGDPRLATMMTKSSSSMGGAVHGGCEKRALSDSKPDLPGASRCSVACGDMDETERLYRRSSFVIQASTTSAEPGWPQDHGAASTDDDSCPESDESSDRGGDTLEHNSEQQEPACALAPSSEETRLSERLSATGDSRTDRSNSKRCTRRRRESLHKLNHAASFLRDFLAV